MIRRTLLLLGMLAAGCRPEPEADSATATKTFFDQLTQKQLSAAFDGAAFSFQHSQTRSEFAAVTHEMGFARRVADRDNRAGNCLNFRRIAENTVSV